MAGTGNAAAEAVREGVREMCKWYVFVYMEGTASQNNSAWTLLIGGSIAPFIVYKGNQNGSSTRDY